MPFSACTVGEVAGAIATSPRTLQRQLAENGTTFQKLRDQIRADLALKYLRQSTLQLAEISEILGFAEPSVFTRSFRRWHGCTPRDARQRIAASPPGTTPAWTPMPIGADRALASADHAHPPPRRRRLPRRRDPAARARARPRAQRLQPRPRQSDWPKGVQAIVGDRASDLGALAGKRFDAVIDTLRLCPGRREEERRGAARRKTYCFVSSISAYESFAHPPIREIDPLADFSKIDPADRDIAHYGPQKAACEAEVQKVFGERALIVRPGLIVGPGDRSGRFSHWPWRALEGGEMLVPDLGDDEPLQFIDVRDLAAWIVRLVERGERGAFNGTGPANGPPCSWSELIAICQDEAEKRGAPPAEPVPVAREVPARRGRRAVERAAALAAFGGSGEPRPFAGRPAARRAHPAW